MKPSLFGKIQSQWDNIVQNLDVKCVCDVLMTKFTLLPNELQRIYSQVTRDDQARQLLEILQVKDDQQFENFLSVLDSTDHKYIADAIRKAKVPREYVEPVACSGPTASTSSSSNITRIPHNGPINTICSLRPSQKGWRICVRVTNKNTISKYKKYGGWNQRFSVSFADDSGSIEAVAFGEAVNKFYELLEEQKVYYISGATIKKANRKFSQGNAYDMVLENDTNIELCDDKDNLDLPTEISYNSVGIDKLEPGRLCVACSGPTASTSSSSKITRIPHNGPINTISSLQPSQKGWRICVRVTNKNTISKYKKYGGWNQRFNISFADDSGSIEAVAFGEAVNKFYELLEEQKVYYISGATIKKANRKFSQGNAYDMVLEDDTNIELCDDKDNLDLPTEISYNSVGIDKLESGRLCASGGATASSSSDGSVDYISSLRPYQNRWKICPRITNKSRITFYRKYGKKLDKRLNLTFTDASGSINAVAFGQTVDKFNDLLKEQKVYYVSNATIKQNKMMFMGGNAYDMILTDDTNIKLCEEEDSLALPTQIPFKSVMIDKLEPGKLYELLKEIGKHNKSPLLLSVISVICGKFLVDEIECMREDLKSCYKTLSTISIAPLDDEQTIPFEEFFIDFIIEYQTERKEWNKQQLLSYKQVFLNKENQRIILTGQSGSGKSTFCKKIVNVWCKEKPNRLIDTTEISDPAISNRPKGTTDEEITQSVHHSHEAVTDKEKELSVYNNCEVTPDEETNQYVPDSSEFSIHQVPDQSVIASSGAIADENIFSQFSLLFYIYAPKISSEENLTEVLYNQCLKRKSDQLLNILQEQPEKVLLILDGMDEMGDHIPQFLQDLLERKLYPRVIVMMAMRPWRISKLQLKPLSHYDLLLEIQGISEKNALKFFQKVIDLNRKHTKMEGLYPLPKEVAVLSSFRNVPLLLLFLAHSWCQDQCLPTRQQDLYQQILDCLIKRCLSKTGSKYIPALTDQDDMNRKKDAFWELYVDSACKAACHFLLQGVSGSSTVIWEKDLRTSLGNDTQLKIGALLDCGILSKLDAFSPLEKKVSITFLHLSIHEYLTSMNLVNNEDAFQNFLTGLKTLNDVLRHENLFIFICGLDADKGHRAFLRICQVCDEDSHVIQYRQGRDNDGQILSSVENLNKMYKACLNEIVSQELVEIPDIIFPSLHERSKLMISRLISSFVKSLCLFNVELHNDVLDLRSLINVVSLKFWNVTMSEECSRSLCSSISDCTHLETLELKDITLHDSVLDLSSLTILTSLSLGEVTMSKDCIRSLSCSIIGCTHLERLELMGINLHDDVIDFSSMTNLISLKLWNVSMSEEYSTSVCQSINHCNRLERLKLKWIELHDGVLDLTSLNKLTSLTLWHVTMSDKCGRVLCGSIYNCTHLEWLDLRGIPLHDGILDFKSLKNLILIDASMSEECSRTLCSKISTCTDLDSLEVKDTMLHDGVIDLSCLTKLTTLSLWQVTMSEECGKSLCGSINGCVHLKSLQLVDIKLHDSIFDLSRLTNLTVLKMDDVIISEDCSVHLCRSISKCTHLKRMQLERIKLHDGVLDLRRLTKLTSLALYNVSMSEECSRSLCCSIRNCKHMEELQLRGSFRGASLALHGGVLDLRHLANLSSLTLDDVIMSKECCKSLCTSISDCTCLEELQLIDVTLHDGVLDLSGLSDLKHLGLSGVTMSVYCEQTLKASLKHCQKLQSVAFE